MSTHQLTREVIKVVASTALMFCLLTDSISQPAQKLVTRKIRLVLPEAIGDAANKATSWDVPGYEKDDVFVPNGPVKISYTGGGIRLSASFKDGKPDGYWSTYFPNGRLESEIRYISGRPNGIQRRYFPNGRLGREDTYRKGDRTSTKVFKKSGKKEKDIRWRNNEIEYAYYLGEKYSYILNILRERFDVQGGNYTAKKICRLRDNGIFRCKTPFQIWNDLNTFLNPEDVLEILDELNSKYHEFGLSTKKGILVQCAGGWDASNISDIGSVVQEASKHRAKMTSTEISAITSSCRDKQISSLTAGADGGGGMDGNQQYQQQVQETKNAINGMVSSCNSQQQWNNTDMIAGIPLALAIIGTVAGVGALILEVKREFDDDGFGEWVPAEPVGGESKTEKRKWEECDDDDCVTEYRDKKSGKIIATEWRNKNGSVTEFPQKDGSKVYESEDANGNKTYRDKYVNGKLQSRYDYSTNTTTEYYEDGSVAVIEDHTAKTRTYYRDGKPSNVLDYTTNTHTQYSPDGKVVKRTPINPDYPMGRPAGSPPPSSTPAPSNPKSTPVNPAPSPNTTPAPNTTPTPNTAPSSTPSSSVPCEDCKNRSCEAMASWWASIAALCDENGWQTYQCSSIVRMMNGCVDSALILPGPDGDLTCPIRRKSSPAESKGRACEMSRQFAAIVDDQRGCEMPKLTNAPGSGNICNNPQAMCLPDQFFDLGFPDDGRPSRPPKPTVDDIDLP